MDDLLFVELALAARALVLEVDALLDANLAEGVPTHGDEGVV